MLTLKTLNKKIRSEVNVKLELVNGGGYFYFVYDDGGKFYETHSVYTYRLNDLSMDQWMETAVSFNEKMVALEVEAA